MQDEQEAAYWDIFDQMTEDWDKILEEKKEWLMVPEVVEKQGTPAATPKATVSKKDGDSKSSGSITVEVPEEKRTVGHNSK
jgi:hypothetical protein